MLAPNPESRAAFAAFARSKPPEEKYDFMDYSGGCALGQYMAYIGIAWSAKDYGRLSQIMKRYPDAICTPMVLGPKTWGALAKRLEE